LESPCELRGHLLNLASVGVGLDPDLEPQSNARFSHILDRSWEHRDPKHRAGQTLLSRSLDAVPTGLPVNWTPTGRER
jgi:hypothetical protein